jgi:putative nucleotidyltransferase with HDIG domain
MNNACATENLLDRIVTTLGDLPASPAIVSTVMGLTSNPDSKVVEISKVLSADQSLTAKVLKLSNSSFYGRPKEVKTLDEAILLLGFFSVRSIVIATSAHTMYTKETKRGPQAHLWEHSLATAVASRQLATRLKHPEKDEIFISALLHDIGKLVLLQKLPEIYLEVVNRVEAENASFTATESEQLGFTHCDVAAVLLDKWQFPSSLRETIFLHHAPPGAVEGEAVPAAHLICLGNLLAKRLGVGFNDARVDDLAATESARLMGLDNASLEQILEETREYYQVETNIFGEA